MVASKIASAGLYALSLFGLSSAFTNPIRNPGGADPQVSYFDGYYYLISTEWTNLQLTRAETIDGLKTAEPKVIYTDPDPSRCCNVWAPEIHLIDGTWYLYYTAGQDGSDNLGGQRSHVLRGTYGFEVTFREMLILICESHRWC